MHEQDASLAAARFGSIALGVWLFLSAFLWPHAPAQRTMAVVIGAATVVIATLSRGSVKIQYLVAALGTALFASIFFLPGYGLGTLYNHLVIGIALFFLGALPGYMARGRGGYLR